MRIAYICMDQGIPVFGRKGCSIHVQEVLRGLIRHGAEIELFTPRPEGSPPVDLRSVRVHPLPIPAHKHPPAREAAAFRFNTELRQALEDEGHFDLVYERYSLWSHAGMDHAQRRGVPGLLEVNAPLIAEQAQHRILVDRARAEWVAHRVFGNATALIAVSQGVASYLESYPCTEQRVHIIPNGVNSDRFPADVRASLPPAPGVFTIGFVGTLKPWHGLQALVDAFARVHAVDATVRLLMVGEGPQRAPLEAELTARGLRDAVHFTGSVDPADIPGLLASMDAAVAPYSCLPHFYFSPLKVYEYMAAGLAVVASRIGELDGLIDHGVSGLLCAPGDPVELACSLLELRADPALRTRLGQAARAKVLEAHTWDWTVLRILDLAGLAPHDQFLAVQGANA